MFSLSPIFHWDGRFFTCCHHIRIEYVKWVSGRAVLSFVVVASVHVRNYPDKATRKTTNTICTMNRSSSQQLTIVLMIKPENSMRKNEGKRNDEKKKVQMLIFLYAGRCNWNICRGETSVFYWWHLLLAFFPLLLSIFARAISVWLERRGKKWYARKWHWKHNTIHSLRTINKTNTNVKCVAERPTTRQM